MKPYIVLAEYHPTILPADKWNSTAGWRAWKVGEDLTALTRQIGLTPLHDPLHGAQTWTPWQSIKLHAEVHKWHPGTHIAEGWHQDGDQTSGANMNHASVVWASNNPTQFMVKDKVYQPKPFEVVLFKNLSCYHRRPPGTPEERFFFHQVVEIPKYMEIP